MGGFSESNASSFGDDLENEEIGADEKVGGFLEEPREDMMVNVGPVSCDDDTEAHETSDSDTQILMMNMIQRCLN